MREQDLGPGVIVALHGHGDDPDSARSWAARSSPPGWEIVTPEAPLDADGARSWFSSGPRGAAPTELSSAVGSVVDVVARVGASGRPVVVVGFSQGGAVALEVAARGVAVDGVVAICGFMAELDQSDTDRHFRTSAPVLILGGERDEHVPAFMSSDAAAVLAGHGADVEVDLLDMGHEVGDPVAGALSDWLGRKLASGPRVSLGLPLERVDTGVELVSGPAVAELASSYERFGFHAAFVTDHPAPDDRWLAGGGHHALEPTVALAVAAAATSRLLLHTNVYVLGYRNPFLAAKALSSLDVLSGGRLVVGVAAGYLRPEFEALGADFDERGRRLDEALELLPRVWAEHGISVTGSGFAARSVTALPHPVQRPHPPIWVGGNSLAAMRRAVRYAQGWSPFPTPGDVSRAVRTASIGDLRDLSDRLTRLEELRLEAGRSERLTTCFVPFSLPGFLADPIGGRARLCAEVAELGELGVDWVALMVPGETRSEVQENAGALADELGLR